MTGCSSVTPLTRMVRPHAAVVTTVGPVHTENFEDGEAGVARAKAEVFDGLETGGIAVLNADNSWFDFLKGEAQKAGAGGLRLYVDTTNTRAQQVYAAMGMNGDHYRVFEDMFTS